MGCRGTIEITKKHWKAYRLVQDSGSYNMFDPNARAMTHLTRKEWVHIMENYDKLKTKYEPKEV